MEHRTNYPCAYLHTRRPLAEALSFTSHEWMPSGLMILCRDIFPLISSNTCLQLAYSSSQVTIYNCNTGNAAMLVWQMLV
jgi:hypothetical protein